MKTPEEIATDVWGDLRPDYRMDKDVFTLAVASAIARDREQRPATPEERKFIDTFTKDEFHEMNAMNLRIEWPKLFNAITSLVGARR